MRRLMTWAAAGVLPALLVSGLMMGCTGSATTEDKAEKPTTGKGSGTGQKTLTAVAANGKGTLKGKIKFVGEKNFKSENDKLLAAMKEKDESHCVAGAKPEELEQQHWRVSDDGGLANVFVWLATPDGQFFKIEKVTDEEKKDVVLDQPKCAFEPHAFVLFPAYRDPADPKKTKETGQKLVIKNSNTTVHNTDMNGGDDNPDSNNQVAPNNAAPLTKVLNPSAHPIDFKCTIHPWMNAFARAFDHPYATVSKKDGTYEIKDVPAGAPVRIVVWHESDTYAKGTDKKGKEVTLKPEVNNYDFEIEKK